MILNTFIQTNSLVTCSLIKFLNYSINDPLPTISLSLPVQQSISSHILLKSSSAPPLFLPPLKAHTRQLFTIERPARESCCVTIRANIFVHRSHNNRGNSFLCNSATIHQTIFVGQFLTLKASGFNYSSFVYFVVYPRDIGRCYQSVQRRQYCDSVRVALWHVRGPRQTQLKSSLLLNR